MSRIEEAMEKAAQLRQGSVRPMVTPVKGADVRPVHIPPQPEEVNEKITPSSPFLVNLNDPYSPTGEEYRKLKSALVKLTKAETFKNTIMVTSSVPHEGKSITALNLAISLAQEFDHTVLLIDADLRRPSIHTYLDMQQRVGLAECLLGEAEISDSIVRAGIGKLSLITAGREIPNPVELFTSQKMQTFIAEIKHRYPDRYIILDTPPVLPFAETRTLAHLVDGILLVIKERQASQDNIKETLDALKGCGMLGIVYNDAATVLQEERYSSYRGYSQYKR